MKFATKPIQHYPPHLRNVATLPWEIKNSNFMQIFSRYGRTCKQIAFWVHRLFCRLSGEATENTIEKTTSVADYGSFWSRSLARFVWAAQFASVSSCAWRLLKHFRRKSLQIIRNTTLCPAFLRKFVCQPLSCEPFQMQTWFLSKSCPRRWIPCWLLTSTAVASQWCDELPVPQINRKRK